MQFYFIRHGQSENNLLWMQTRSNKGRGEDPALTETGWLQAKRVAQYARDATSVTLGLDGDNLPAPGLGFTHLYCSLMIRSVATGIVLARELGLPLVAWEELHEGGGIWLEDEQTGERVGRAGKNRTYFEIHYPDLTLPDTLGDAGWWNRPFEEYEQRVQRAQRFLRDLLDRHGGTEDRVAVISHGGFYGYFMSVLLDLAANDGYWFALHNTGMTRIDFRDDKVGLVFLNRVDFLPQELVT
jgi:2,3-bisphosphoglycerate-dependent phosphoglycerate mutase